MMDKNIIYCCFLFYGSSMTEMFHVKMPIFSKTIDFSSRSDRPESKNKL